ncbi:uncharacterized protein LOC111694354 [Trichogramma pretiosum]|uniref:uncharacterized protein LOC111694354 n=1 Tax=Trichogramma pretiosum TaxID=7493 RepID=UPI000C719BB4|nr:uncharacterized protein LOC111694354 [Trichogramma pretiosum]
MFSKIALLFIFGCIGLVLSSPVPSDSQTEEVSSTPSKPETAVTAATPTKIAMMSPFKNFDSAGLEILQEIIGGLTDRFGDAYVKTYDQQKGSIDETIKSIKDMGKLGVESGVNLMKNGLEFFFIVPTFTRHVAANEG